MSDDWTEHRDKTSGLPYYYNRKTKETTWEKPAAVEAQGDQGGGVWEQFQDDSGLYYYFNAVTNVTQWDRPLDFMDAEEEYSDEEEEVAEEKVVEALPHKSATQELNVPRSNLSFVATSRHTPSVSRKGKKSSVLLNKPKVTRTTFTIAETKQAPSVAKKPGKKSRKDKSAAGQAKVVVEVFLQDLQPISKMNQEKVVSTLKVCVMGIPLLFTKTLVSFLLFGDRKQPNKRRYGLMWACGLTSDLDGELTPAAGRAMDLLANLVHTDFHAHSTFRLVLNAATPPYIKSMKLGLHTYQKNGNTNGVKQVCGVLSIPVPTVEVDSKRSQSMKKQRVSRMLNSKLETHINLTPQQLQKKNILKTESKQETVKKKMWIWRVLDVFFGSTDNPSEHTAVVAREKESKSSIASAPQPNGTSGSNKGKQGSRSKGAPKKIANLHARSTKEEVVKRGILRKPKYFNVSLSTLKAEALDRDGVPLLLPYLFKYLSHQWLDEPGLFRVSGGHSQMQQMKSKFDFDEKFPILHKTETTKVTNPHAVAGLIKLYLRELPDCLLRCSLYDSWLAIGQGEDWDAIQTVIGQLPEENKQVLFSLLDFLQTVEKQHESNHMTVDNLAICFAPTLLRREKPTLADMRNAKHLIGVVSNMIRLHVPKAKSPNLPTKPKKGGGPPPRKTGGPPPRKTAGPPPRAKKETLPALDRKTSRGPPPRKGPPAKPVNKVRKEWKRFFNETHECYYYHNATTNQTQWTKPEGW